MVASCSTGLDSQMDTLLDEVEGSLGYVNSISSEDMAKMTGWFLRRGTDSQKAAALYCLGRAQYNEKGYSSAIVTYTKALELAVQAGDTRREGLICFDMAHTCGASGNTSDEMLYLARAAEAFKASGLDDMGQKALLEIGQVHSALGKYEEAEGIFRSVLYDAHELKDSLLEARCLESYAALAVGRDSLDPALAIDLLGRAAGELKYPLSSSDKGILAYSYSLLGNSQEASRWLSEARMAAETDDEAADIDFREYQIASRSGDTRRALAALERVTEYADKAQSASLQETVAASQRDYILSQADAQAQKLKAARLKMWLLALAALLVIAAVVVAWFYYRSTQERLLEAEKAERDRYMSIAEDLKDRLAASRGPGFEALERLCEQYYIYEGTENLQPKIFKEVKSIVEGLRSDKGVQKTLEEMLDGSKDGVMTKLRAEFQSWKEDDFLLYSFAAAGFSSTTMSTLMEKDKSVIYNRVWRLKGRISGSASRYKDFFLECLNNR